MLALEECGLQPITPEGTYFITADIRGRRPDGDGLAFCRELPKQAGIVAIPAAVLYDPRHEAEGRHLVRFTFCKQLSTISRASEQLRAWA